VVRVVDHGLDGFLGHAGVVFEFQRLNGAAIVAVAHRAHETADRAHTGVTRSQRSHLGIQVEVLGLDKNTWWPHGAIVAPARIRPRCCRW
jgi:hypothetical protein